MKQKRDTDIIHSQSVWNNFEKLGKEVQLFEEFGGSFRLQFEIG